MSSPQEAPPRARSALAAAFLSLLFPGLGHAYAGAYQRALGFATPLVLFVALVGGIALRMDRGELLGLLLANLGPIFVLNVILAVYRAAAIIDAWRVVTYSNAYALSGGGRLGRPRIRLEPIGLAGLLAVLLVMLGVHVVVARYDAQAQDLVNCVFDDQGTATGCDEPDASASPDSSASDEPLGSASPSLATPKESIGSAAPSSTPLPPWDGKERLNILLIDSDQRPREGTYNTDTLIVVSIDPQSGQVAMFSLPRDTVNVPVPPGKAQQVWGTTYGNKINSWFTQNRGRSDLWPGNDRQRGYNALKAILGNLYGLDIRYYVEVNFDGFKKVIDAVGGVTINVQIPVTDDRYPGDDGRLRRVYIPAGVQHMTGAQALIYARSRHDSDDFDRGQRQQRVLLSLRQQTDVATLLPKLDDLVSALTKAVHTDIPVGVLPKLLGLADQIDTRNIRSYVFAPPLYGSQGTTSNGIYILQPKVDRIRAAVASAFKVDRNLEPQRQKLASEAGRIWVLNGTGQQGEGSRIAAYLEYYGLDASAPNQRPDTSGLAQTRIVVYNGAEARLPDTVAFLQKVFGVTVRTATDKNARADIIITTAGSTPDLTPPP